MICGQNLQVFANKQFLTEQQQPGGVAGSGNEMIRLYSPDETHHDSAAHVNIAASELPSSSIRCVLCISHTIRLLFISRE